MIVSGLRVSGRCAIGPVIEGCAFANSLAAVTASRGVHLRTLAAAVLALSATAMAPGRAEADGPGKISRPYIWSGFYIGGHVGHGWGEEVWSLPEPIPNTTFFGSAGLPDQSPSGLLAGGQIGVNFQIGPWVFGVEGKVSWADLEDNSTRVLSSVATADFRSRVEYLGDVTARLGYTIQPTVLLYLKGGVAFDSSRLDSALTILSQTSATVTLQQDRIGWTIGGGVEWALAGPWSFKIEYQYMDFGSDTDNATFTVPGEGSFTVPVTLEQDIHLVRVGINYRFGDR
jgi:outer membrane immunogenic protein